MADAEEANVEQVEVSFRLDPEGRTALLSSLPDGNAPRSLNYATRVIATQWGEFPSRMNNNDDNDHDDDSATVLRARSSVPSGPHPQPESPHVLYDYDDELLLDCEIADCSLLPRTFWVPCATSLSSSVSSIKEDNANSFQPRCTLEQMARDIFDYHTAHCRGSFDPTTSGSEWWVQVRPLPEPTHRKTRDDTDEDLIHGCLTNDEERNGVTFHWDKDEDLRLLCGGTVYVHPHLSTVTYLTAIGAPTLVAEGYRIHNLTGEWIPPNESNCIVDDDDEEVKGGVTAHTNNTAAAAFISWPAIGKHLCFDGRYLHAAPSNLQRPGEFEDQCRVPDQSSTVQRRRYRRCTFLVNVWLNHKPFHVSPFPETMIDKLSGYRHPSVTATRTTSRRMRLLFDRTITNGTLDVTRVTTAEVQADKTVQLSVAPETVKNSPHSTTSSVDQGWVQQFTWPLGDCGSEQTIKACIPLTVVQSKAVEGGNLRIQWSTSVNRDFGMVLVKEKSDTEEERNCKRPRINTTSEGPMFLAL